MGLAVVFSKDQNDASNVAAAAAVDLDPTSTEISVDDLQAQDEALVQAVSRRSRYPQRAAKYLGMTLKKKFSIQMNMLIMIWWKAN